MSILLSFLRSTFRQIARGKAEPENADQAPSMPKIEIVSATRLAEKDFWIRSALGLSLRRLSQHEGRLIANISFENTHGLPAIYNAAIADSGDSDILVFVHDDVWINDNFFSDRVIEGLARFDVIGVAGNRHRANGPAWAFVDTRLTWDDRARLTGSIGSGSDPFSPILYFGYAPAECQLLDGVFLCARRSTLVKRGISFDPRFDFHFYDLDFCRNSRRKGLRLGTWPVCLTHQKTVSAFGSDAWHRAYEAYREKWDD